MFFVLPKETNSKSTKINKKPPAHIAGGYINSSRPYRDTTYKNKGQDSEHLNSIHHLEERTHVILVYGERRVIR